MISANVSGEVAAVTDMTTAESITYAYLAADYTTWKASPAALASANLLLNTSINDPYFQFFYCGGSRDFIYTCYKYQPATSTDGLPRFDTDSTGVKAVYYNGSTADEKAVTLTGALPGMVSAASGLVAAVLAVSMF